MAEKKQNKPVKKHLKNLSKNYWAIAAIILGVLLIVALIYPRNSSISASAAGQSVLDFAEQQGIEASLVKVNEQDSLYEVVLEMQGQQVPVYTTKDGKYLIAQPIPLTGQAINTQNTQDTQTTEVPKSDKPNIDLFVMSFCPYGNEAENTMQPVYNLLKDKINFNVHYIVSVSGDNIQSLHGQTEVDQNIRESCVLKNNNLDKWWEFTIYVNKNCGSSGDCWKEAAEKAGLSVSNIESCQSSKGIELMKQNAQASSSAGASGSPTLLINGVKSRAVYQYGDSEAYKQAICSAFNQAPEECSQELGTSTSVPTGGSC